MTDLPPPELLTRLEALMHRRSVAWLRTTGGYTTAERWVVRFEDGSSCFVKSGADHLSTFLRAEYHLAYSRIEAPFLARLIAWEDDGVAPVLVLEDLSAAHWPPPWSDARVQAVLATLDEVHALDPEPDHLPPIDAARLRAGWHAIAADPAPFLSLKLCSERWLSRALPVLLDAADTVLLEGEAVCHFDVRSDNLCFRGDQAILVDWNLLCRANRDIDIAAWLPSLHSEGGPLPEDVYDLDPTWPALVAGYWAFHAGLPPIPQAPMVRHVQLSQLRSALPWAQRALGLPPLDGPNAP